MIDVRAYWPFDLTGTTRKRTFRYFSPDPALVPIISVFWWGPREQALIYSDYDANGVWKDDWFLRFDPREGVIEYRDDYPQTGVAATLFGTRKKLWFSTPIKWGNVVHVGGSVANIATVDPWRSHPPQFGSCVQSVQFESLLKSAVVRGREFEDVLQMTYLQRWGGKCGGARYWMARGVGPVAIEWLGVPPEDVKWLGVDHSKIHMITTARLEAEVDEAELIA